VSGCWRRAFGALAALLGAWFAGGAVPAGAQSTAPVAPAPAGTHVPGSELEVYVMTMGQGDLLWERFGHNAIGIRDTLAGTDVVYNWGMFSFEQPGFLPRFLRGDMQYWMAPYDARLTIEAYRQIDRSVTLQYLNLSAQQKDSLRRLVEWNALDENKFYPYDYYRDNCSTRVRDAVDRVTGGALRAAFERDATTMTYRDHSLRLMEGMFWTRTGMDFGLGKRTDQPLSGWEASFVPMELQRRLREVRVNDASGNPVPLVSREEAVFEARRTGERMDVPRLVPGFLVAGMLVAAACFALGYRTPGSVGATSLALAWAVAAGFFGLLLFLLWTATGHVAAHANQNLLFAHPIWLGVAVLIPLVHRGRAVRNALLFVVRLTAVLTLVGAVVALTPIGQASGSIAAFVVPVNLSVYLLVLRVVFLAQQAAATTPGSAPRVARAAAGAARRDS